MKNKSIFIVVELYQEGNRADYNLSWAYDNLEAAQAHLRRLVDDVYIEGPLVEYANNKSRKEVAVPGQYRLGEWRVRDQRPYFWRIEKFEDICYFWEFDLREIEVRNLDISQAKFESAE